MLTLPEKYPQPGFYHHYKHDTAKGMRDYAYEVTSIGPHTETGEWHVIYRPLYEEAEVFQASKELGVPVSDPRPLDMWIADVPKGKDGAMIPRFSRITDPIIVAQLERVKESMYGMQ